MLAFIVPCVFALWFGISFLHWRLPVFLCSCCYLGLAETTKRLLFKFVRVVFLVLQTDMPQSVLGS